MELVPMLVSCEADSTAPSCARCLASSAPLLACQPGHRRLRERSSWRGRTPAETMNGNDPQETTQRGQLQGSGFRVRVQLASSSFLGGPSK
eukprot:9722655-Alexandrium_andersonii.AAC.1